MEKIEYDVVKMAAQATPWIAQSMSPTHMKLVAESQLKNPNPIVAAP
jgi:hypothetical protein